MGFGPAVIRGLRADARAGIAAASLTAALKGGCRAPAEGAKSRSSHRNAGRASVSACRLRRCLCYPIAEQELRGHPRKEIVGGPAALLRSPSFVRYGPASPAHTARK